MSKRNKHLLWALWILMSLVLAGYLLAMVMDKADAQFLMPGQLSNGHHQLVDNCAACHTDPLGGGKVLQQACVNCHGDVRKKPFDSHPAAKFKDPRNAGRLEKIDALHCVTCHTEHRPEITSKNGLTQPKDLCVHCHAEVAKERPSHQGMAFATCTSSGCHNFHDNRALYTNFLVKHLHEAYTKPAEEAVVLSREFGSMVVDLPNYPHERYPLQVLTINDADGSGDDVRDPGIHQDWLETAHAKAGVNCTACHRPPDSEGQPGVWTDHPGATGCAQCHGLETARFGKGKHGMRLAAGLSPITPAQSRLPMQPDAAHQQLTCLSCHGAHRFDVQKAAVEACISCHDDNHSRAFDKSPHAHRWQQVQAGALAVEQGVSCATCHMPRINFEVNDWTSRVMVEHNQSATLSPNSKMLRPVCLQCHGLGFSLDALADKALIDKNFTGQPKVHVDSMDLAEQDNKRRREKSGGEDTGMFGF